MTDTQPDSAPRFLKLEDVAEELATSRAQIYALVRDGVLPAIKIGGRGQWRIERAKLEDYIADAYRETAQFVLENPLYKEEEAQTDPEAQSDEELPGED